MPFAALGTTSLALLCAVMTFALAKRDLTAFPPLIPASVLKVEVALKKEPSVFKLTVYLAPKDFYTHN